MSYRTGTARAPRRRLLRTAAIVTLLILAPLLVLCVVPVSARAQARSDSTGNATLHGTVRDSTDSPIVAASVSIFGVPGSTATNEKGEFSLANLPSGRRVVQVVALGFRPRLVTVVLSNDTAVVTVSLDRANVVLDSVRARARAHHRELPPPA
jgi:hypothetical protein